MKNLEQRVREWIVTRLGADHMAPGERAMRLLEEAIELAQSEGVTEAMVHAQASHVYNRPSGYPLQEAGGVAVCLLGWCAAAETTFQEVATREVERIESKPLSEIRGSLARKADADLVTALTPSEER